jgi:hypothetical protein
MLQIATFSLPEQQEEANAFLRTHKPIGNIEFNKDMIFIGYETGEVPVEYEIAQLQEMLVGTKSALFQQEVALQVLQYELADLNPKHNRPKYEEIEAQIRNVRKGMDIQDVKIAFVEKRIQDLQTGNAIEKPSTETSQGAAETDTTAAAGN